MTIADFAVLPVQAQSSLTALAAALQGVAPSDVKAWVCNVADLPATGQIAPLVSDVDSWAGKSRLCLYYFECNQAQVDLQAVRRAFADAKAAEENDRAYPRLNPSSHCLYVGSSQSVSKRLAEHLGYGAARTYALQLQHWARPLGLKFSFVCAKYADSTPYQVVQALEDALWQSRRPMFGRQGRR